MPFLARYLWVGGDKITSARLNRVEQMSPNRIFILMVAGGGGGAGCSAALRRGAGGGAGGVAMLTHLISSGDAFTITIGNGGTGGANTPTKGGNTTLAGPGGLTYTVEGGGLAGVGVVGGNGGCGGGGGISTEPLRGGAGGNDGHHGGHGVYPEGSSTRPEIGGAGGGAGEAGESAWIGRNYSSSAAWDEVDIDRFYANGGGGRQWINGLMYGGGGANGVPLSRGGVGGGGDAAAATPGNGGNGTINRGGGGAGASANSATQRTGGNGGSGIVIIAYYGDRGASDIRATGGTITSSDGTGLIKHEFTGNGTFTWL